MGLLPDDYYTNALKENNTTTPPSTGGSVQPVQPTQNSANIPTTGGPELVPAPTPVSLPPPTSDPFPQLTPEEQTAKFGGPVGSPEYLKYQANRSNLGRLPRELASTVGVQLPDQQSWDKMSTMEHAEEITGASLKAVAMAIIGFPKTVANIPVGIAKTIGQGWGKVTGKPVVENDNPFTRTFKDVPSYFESYDQARKSGMGPLASAVMTAGRAGQDSLILDQVAHAVGNSFAPRAQTLVEGETLKTTEPVQTVLKQEQDKLATKRGNNSPSEYHPMTKTDAKNFGGNSGNTFIKFTPAVADGSKVELSIVKLNSSIGNLIDKVKSKFGVDSGKTSGKFGPETKLYSQILDVGKNPELASLETPKTGAGDVTIPSAPLKGMADKPVTPENLANLDAIGKMNEVDPSLQEGVIKALTGKDVVGDMNQMEYSQVGQALSKLGKSSEHAPEAIGFGNWMKNYFSPTRYWTRDVQEATGIPVHDVHMQIETGARVAKVAEKTQLGNLYSDPVIEKYSGSKYAPERALVKSYMEGDTSAITDNSSLTPEVKADLIHSAGVFDAYMKGVAQDVGMDPKVFLDNYAPHVQERGGVFQLYKESGNVPSGSEAFFRQKRSGGLYSQINDMWALADIYTRSAYKGKFLGPALDAANEVNKQLPSGVKERFSSYVQEKLGYGGKLEKVMDFTAESLNKKLGLNLPADTARQVTNQVLNTMYSSAMSQPATWLRNTFQYPTMGFAQWGSKFMADALGMAYSKAGMDEFLKSGFSVDLGVPFGEDLTKEASTMGKISNAYREGTQGILKPYSWVENKNRAPMYFQSKMVFDDAVAKFNKGELTWTQAEKAMGLDKMSPVDANQIRSKLTSGDISGARDLLIQNAIDDTQFPYRKGESWRLGYGMAGKISTPFMQWPVEYLHTLGKWVTTGQWDKLARWYASTSLISRTFSQQYNTNFSNSLGFSPLMNVNLSPPPLTFIQNGLGLIYNHLNDNEQAYTKNGDELMKELKLAIPGGGEGSNILKFYDAYKKGPNENGEYAVPDSSGRPTFYNFRDLFWNALGMPTNQKVANQQLQTDMSRSKFEYTQAKNNVLGLYQDGMSLGNAGKTDAAKAKIDEANQLIEEYAKQGMNLTPNETEFNKFYIPANEQTYNLLPEGLKAKFAPRVFTQSNQ